MMRNGFTVEDYGNKKVLTQNSAKLNVRIEIGGADLVIQNMDIDFDFVKTSSSKDSNKSKITIYNISDSTFQRIFEKMYAVDLYTWHGDDEPALTFRGYPQIPPKLGTYVGRINTAKGFLASPIKQDNRGQFDIPTVIELVDGKAAYQNSVINKTYRTKVSSDQIIKDCIEAMGVGVIKISKQLPIKYYSSYKAVGKPNVILDRILNAVSGRWNIQNGLIQILSKSERSEGTFAVVLNPSNSTKPLPHGTDEVIISTRFIPFLNADDYVKCEFNNLAGVYQVYEVIGEGSNSGTGAETKIVLKVPTIKVKRKKKKKDADVSNV